MTEERDSVKAKLDALTGLDALSARLDAAQGADDLNRRAETAEAALRNLLAQLQQVIEQWRESTYRKPIQLTPADAIQLCADQLAALIDRSRPGETEKEEEAFTAAEHARALNYALALMRDRVSVEAPYNRALVQRHIYALIDLVALVPVEPIEDCKPAEAPKEQS